MYSSNSTFERAEKNGFEIVTGQIKNINFIFPFFITQNKNFKYLIFAVVCSVRKGIRMGQRSQNSFFAGASPHPKDTADLLLLWKDYEPYVLSIMIFLKNKKCHTESRYSKLTTVK